MTCQDIQDKYGFVVIAYQVQAEYEAEKEAGVVNSDTVNSSMGDGIKLGVVGDATFEEWARQCDACGDPVFHWSEGPHVGYLKVIAE